MVKDAPGSGRGRLWVMAAILGCLALAVVLYFEFIRSGSSVSNSADGSPETKLTVTHPDGSEIRGLEVEELAGSDAEGLAAASSAESPVFDVEATEPLNGRAELRFSIPAGLSAEQREQLLVAHRERENEMWLLSPGRIEGDDYVFETDRFSFFQLRLPEIEISLPGRGGIEEEILGVRAPDKKCANEPTALRLEIESPGSEADPLIQGCLDSEGDRVLLQIANKRSVALEVAEGAGVDLLNTSGRGLSEEFWHQVNEELPGAGELIPGGGSGVLEISDPPRTAEFVIDTAAVPIDLLIALVTRGQASTAQKNAAKLAAFAGCVQRASQGGLSFSTLRNLFVECGELLEGSALAVSGSMLFGLPATGYQLIDSVRALGGMRASAAVDVDLGGPLDVSSLGPVELGMTSSEVEAAGIALAAPHGLACRSPVENPHDVFFEFGLEDEVTAIGLGPDSDVVTRAGLGIGDSVSEAERAYGAELDFVGFGPQADEVGQGTDYIYDPAGQNDGAIQLWTFDGEVVGIYAARPNDIRDEFCA